MAKVSTYTEVTAASGDKIYVARSGTSRIVDADNFATAAQGALADSATQPADSVTTLNMSTAKILGRTTASSGAVEEISVGSGLTLSGGTLSNSGGAPTDATYIVQTANGTLTNEQALGSLATGILKNTTTTGVLSIAAAGTDYVGTGAVTTSGLTQATNKMLGRSTASTGAIEEISVGTGLSLSAGTLSATGSGDVATDAIWDAAGDLAIGTGANTAARLAIGTSGYVLTSNGTTAAWAAATGGTGTSFLVAQVFS